MTTAYDSSRLFSGNLWTGLTNGELVGFLVSKDMAPIFMKIVSRGAAAGSDFAVVGFKDEAAYQDIFTYTKHKCEICAPGRGFSISWNSDKRGKPTQQPLPPQSVPPRPRGLIFFSARLRQIRWCCRNYRLQKPRAALRPWAHARSRQQGPCRSPPRISELR